MSRSARRDDGQAHHELASPAGALAVRGDGPAVQLDQDASQRQAHAQAVLGVGQRPIGLRAQIEHERLHRVGWDLQLTQYGDGMWRATFHVTGQAHSIVGGSAWEPTPWRAVQQAGWSAVLRTDH